MPKGGKSTGKNPIIPEGGQDTSEFKIPGHLRDAFSRKCPETPKLTRCTKPMLSKGGQSTDMIPVLQVVSIPPPLCKLSGNPPLCPPDNARTLQICPDKIHTFKWSCWHLSISSMVSHFLFFSSNMFLLSSTTLHCHESKCNYFQVQVLASFSASMAGRCCPMLTKFPDI